MSDPYRTSSWPQVPPESAVRRQPYAHQPARVPLSDAYRGLDRGTDPPFSNDPYSLPDSDGRTWSATFEAIGPVCTGPSRDGMSGAASAGPRTRSDDGSHGSPPDRPLPGPVGLTANRALVQRFYAQRKADGDQGSDFAFPFAPDGRCEHREHWWRLRGKNKSSYFCCTLCLVGWRRPSTTD